MTATILWLSLEQAAACYFLESLEESEIAIVRRIKEDIHNIVKCIVIIENEIFERTTDL